MSLTQWHRWYLMTSLVVLLGSYRAYSGDMFGPLIVSGGLHATSASLVSTTFATKAYTSDGLYVNQVAASITYLDNKTYCWVIIDSATTGNLLTFTRVTGTHYLIDCASGATQPTLPSTSAWLMRVKTASGAITAVQSMFAARSPVSTALSLINVQDYGADPDDPEDDTEAILTAIAAIPGTDKGAGCLYFPLPKTLTGFYKVSSTLNLSEKWNACMVAPALLTRGRDDTDAGRRALIKWYGAADTDVIVLHNLISFDLINISVDCRDVAGTVGIALGPRVTQASVVKQVRAHHGEVMHCDIGIRNGDWSNNGPDVANNSFQDFYVHDNVSEGFAQYSGNGLLYLGPNILMEHNGYDPKTATHGGEAATLQVGAHVRVSGGTVHVLDYVGVSGTGFTEHPVDGDIVLDSAGLVATNVWSEVGTPVIISRGSSTKSSYVHGLLHYSASMTDASTPTSVIWQGDNPLIISGFLFGKVDVQGGTNTLVMDQGTRFYSGAQHTLGLVPTFTGFAVTTSLAYSGFPTGAQRGRLALGRPPRTDIGSTFDDPPGIEQTGRELRAQHVYCTTDANGEGCNTLAVQRGGANNPGGWHFLGNGYFDTAGNIKSIAAGRMSWFTFSGGDPALGHPNIRLLYDNAAAAGETKFVGTETLHFGVTTVSTGFGLVPTLNLGTHKAVWASGPPTAGTWAVGDVAFNSTPASGQPSGWMCSVAGTPGTWKALANIP